MRIFPKVKWNDLKIRERVLHVDFTTLELLRCLLFLTWGLSTTGCFGHFSFNSLPAYYVFCYLLVSPPTRSWEYLESGRFLSFSQKGKWTLIFHYSSIKYFTWLENMWPFMELMIALGRYEPWTRMFSMW